VGSRKRSGSGRVLDFFTLRRTASPLIPPIADPAPAGDHPGLEGKPYARRRPRYIMDLGQLLHRSGVVLERSAERRQPRNDSDVDHLEAAQTQPIARPRCGVSMSWCDHRGVSETTGSGLKAVAGSRSVTRTRASAVVTRWGGRDGSAGGGCRIARTGTAEALSR
jgi:hypothetical protein